MNMHASISAASAARLPANQRPGYAAKMLELFIKLDALRREYCPMEDDTMDAITEATFAVGRSVIDAPAIDEATIATKFKYAALLIEDPDGLMTQERNALDRALHDLAGMRNAEWNAMCGKDHPWYREVNQ